MVAGRATYHSFGQRSQTGTLAQRYGFTGREHDAESGLIHFRARAYDPGTGMFLQRDPIGFAAGDLNLYAYVWNDPYGWTDPSGLAVSTDFLRLTGAGIGAGIVGCAALEPCRGGIASGVQSAAAGIAAALASLGDLWNWMSRGDGETATPGPGHNGGPPLNDPPPPLDPLSALLAALAAIQAHLSEITGNTLQFEFETPGGTVEFRGDFTLEGSHLTIDNVLIYGSGANSVGTSELRSIVDAIGNASGVQTVTLNGYRASGADRGREVSITMNVRPR